MTNKYKNRQLESPPNCLEFINKPSIDSRSGITKLHITKRQSTVAIQDMESKLDYEYEWKKKDFNSFMTLTNGDQRICSVDSKLWASQYSVRSSSQCVGTLNHQTTRWKDRYFGKFMTLSKNRVDIYIKCEGKMTYIFLGDPLNKGKLIAQCTKQSGIKQKNIKGIIESQYHMSISSNVDNEMMITLWLITIENVTKSSFLC